MGIRVEGRLRDSDSWFRKSAGISVKYTIKVPVEFDIELKTSGGSIQIETIEGEISAHSSGGSLNQPSEWGNLFLRVYLMWD